MVEVVFFDVDDASAYVREELARFGGKKIPTRARGNRRERGRRDRARGETTREMAGETTDAGKSIRVLFGGRFGGAFGWRAVARFVF